MKPRPLPGSRHHERRKIALRLAVILGVLLASVLILLTLLFLLGSEEGRSAEESQTPLRDEGNLLVMRPGSERNPRGFANTDSGRVGFDRCEPGEIHS